MDEGVCYPSSQTAQDNRVGKDLRPISITSPVGKICMQASTDRISDQVQSAKCKEMVVSFKKQLPEMPEKYCDHDLDYDINGVVITLLKELIRFQDRLYLKDPVKAKAKRRFVCGLREVFKHANLKRLKCVIVTPNMEPTKSKGGLNDLLSNIITVCHSQNVPVVFSLNRQILGKVLLKKVPVSVVGIFYYDGAQNYFKSLMELTKIARETYKDKFEAARQKFLSEKKQEANDSEVSDGHDNAKQLKTSENEHADHGEKSAEISKMEATITELETTLPMTKTSTTKITADLVKQDGNITGGKGESFMLADTTVSCNTQTVMHVFENEDDRTPDVAGVQAVCAVGKHQGNVMLGSNSENADVKDDEASVNEEIKPFFAGELRESWNTASVMPVCELKKIPTPDVAGVPAGCAAGKDQGNVMLGCSSETETVCFEDGEPTGNEERAEAFLTDERVSCDTGTVPSLCELQESHYASQSEISVNEELEPFLTDEKVSCDTGTVPSLCELQESHYPSQSEHEKADQGKITVNEELEPFLADEKVSCNTGTVPSLCEPIITEIERNVALETCQSEHEKADLKQGEISVNEELEQFLADEKVSCNTGTVTSLCEPVITELERNVALETSQSENE